LLQRSRGQRSFRGRGRRSSRESDQRRIGSELRDAVLVEDDAFVLGVPAEGSKAGWRRSMSLVHPRADGAFTGLVIFGGAIFPPEVDHLEMDLRAAG
jgi:hypothetical protein